MKQDKNFIIRLKAAIGKRMKETGVTAAFLNGSKNYEEYQKVERRFFESLEDIELAYLQGKKNIQPHAATVTAKRMGLYNPYREYDKGMDDAYMGKESQRSSGQYNVGYNRLLQIEEEEQRKEENEKLINPSAEE